MPRSWAEFLAAKGDPHVPPLQGLSSATKVEEAEEGLEEVEAEGAKEAEEAEEAEEEGQEGAAHTLLYAERLSVFLDLASLLDWLAPGLGCANLGIVQEKKMGEYRRCSPPRNLPQAYGLA